MLFDRHKYTNRTEQTSAQFQVPAVKVAASQYDCPQDPYACLERFEPGNRRAPLLAPDRESLGPRQGKRYAGSEAASAPGGQTEFDSTYQARHWLHQMEKSGK